MVARPGDAPDAPTVEIIVPDFPDSMGPAMGDPIVALRLQYDAWRAANPPDDSGCAGGDTTSTGDGTGTGEPGDSGDPDGGEATDDGGDPTASDSGDDGGQITATDADGSDGGESEGTGKGCGCAADPTGSLAWLLIVGATRPRRI